MIKVTLKGGTVKEYDAPLTAYEIASSIGAGLAKSACAAKIGGAVKDLRTVINTDTALDILTFDDKEGRAAFRHTASHVLAQAVKRLYPKVLLAIGPAVDDGFYYDFDVDTPFSESDLAAIEAEMKKIVKENYKVEMYTLPPDEALKFLEAQGEPYKVELCKKHADKGETISFARQGEFTDLCAGPHLMSTGAVKAFKLTSATGAYWKGDSNNKMLCRVYGTAFPKASQLDEHLAAMEEAKKRDHNKLGRELELFTTSPVIGQGLPVLLPKGTRVVQLLQRWVEDEEESRGYLLTKTPLLAKSDLYKISGHWDHYRDGLFILGDPDKADAAGEEVFALRPMTCPFQFQAYLNKPRSYRDLPLRYAETSTLFRNEASGEMHGLIRVRQFTISEGHIACTPEQVEEEFRGCVELANYMLKTVGLHEDVSYRFSKWDENDKDKYIGEKESWESTQNLMRGILDNLGIDYEEADGEAAFYGPKLDIQIRNVFGKEDTLITVQIDFQLAEKFGMVYTDSDGGKKYPVVIHRTSIGCYERTLALLIEKYAGAFPLWLAPVGVMIMPIADRHNDYCREIEKELRSRHVRCEVDTRSEKIGFKIREAQLTKIPYMLIIGDSEVSENKLAARSRKEGDLGTFEPAAFYEKLIKEIEEKTI